MPDLSAYSRTGRVQLGPGSDLVELQGPQGAHCTAIVFHPEYRGHNAVNAALHVVLGFLESPMVGGLAELVTYDLAESTFVYPTGKVWSVAEVVRTVSDMGEAAGVRAGMEWLAHVGQILVEAAEAGEQAAVYSHGGVTPWRVVIDADGRVQVIGHALPQVEILAFHEDPTRIPREDAFRYCPPERMESRKENFSSDLFGAALIAFEIMTGRPVYDGLVDEIRARAARGETSRRLHQHRDVLPDPVREVLATALKPDIRDRHPSGEAFLAAVDLAMRDRRVTGPGLREVMSRVAKHVPRARQELDPARTSMLSRDALKAMLDDEAAPAAPAPPAGAVRVSIPAGRARPATPAVPEDLPGPDAGAAMPVPHPAPAAAAPPEVPRAPVPGARPNPRQGAPAVVAPLASDPVVSGAAPVPAPAPPPGPPGRPVMGARSNPRASDPVASPEHAPPVTSLPAPSAPPPPTPPLVAPPPVAPPPVAPPPALPAERPAEPVAPSGSTTGAFARPLDARSLLARVRASGSDEARSVEAALRTSGAHTPPPTARAPASAEPVRPPPVAVSVPPSAPPPGPPPAAAPHAGPAPVPAAPPPAPPPAATSGAGAPAASSRPPSAPPPAAPPPAPPAARGEEGVLATGAVVAPPPVVRAVEPPVARFLGTVGGDEGSDEVDEAATAAFVRPAPRVAPPRPAPPEAPPPAPVPAAAPAPVRTPVTPAAAEARPHVAGTDPSDEATEPPSRTRQLAWRLRVGDRTRPGTPAAGATPLGALVADLFGVVLPWPVALDGRWSGWARLGTVAAPLPPETRLDALGPDPLLVLHPVEARLARVQVRAEGGRTVRIELATSVPVGTLAAGLRALLELPEGEWVLVAGGRRLPPFAILEDLPASERSVVALERA